MSNAPTHRLALAIETAESFADHSKVVAVLDDEAWDALAGASYSAWLYPVWFERGGGIPPGVPAFMDAESGWPVVRRSEWEAAHNPEGDK